MTQILEQTQRPTRVRYKVVAMMVLLAMITYLDRVSISKMAPHIMEDLSLDKVQMGYVFSAFTLAYALFEVPTAAFADRLGTRSVLTRIVLWWSAFTMATATALNFVWLLVVRFLFGAGEAGAWPCAARTFSRWIPTHERGRVQGIFFAGALLAGGLTPLLTTLLLNYMSWRVVFLLYGVVGVVWAAGWYAWGRDEPAEHTSVNDQERQYIAAGLSAGGGQSDHGHLPWRVLLTDRNLWTIYLLYFPNSFIYYFCITWLPTYLHERHGLESAALGFLAGLPLLLGMVGVLSGGWVCDRMTARFGPRIGRCLLGAAAYGLSALAIVAATLSASPWLAAGLISLSVAATNFTLSASWNISTEIGGDHAAVVTAAMNTSGQVGGMFCPLIVAYSLKWLGSWDFTLYLMGSLFMIGAVAWVLVDPRKRVVA